MYIYQILIFLLSSDLYAGRASKECKDGDTPFYYANHTGKGMGNTAVRVDGVPTLKSLLEGSYDKKSIGNLKHCEDDCTFPQKDPNFGGLTFEAKNGFCHRFIDSNGNYGEWGRHIVNWLEEQGDNSIFMKKKFGEMEKDCPNFARFNKEQRQFFWVWLFAAIAYAESGCGRTLEANCQGGKTCIGIFQLDKDANNRGWRGPTCKAPSDKIKNDHMLNIRCSLEIMAEILLGKCGEYEASGEIYRINKRNTNYWQHLRSKRGGDIGKMLRELPMCKQLKNI